MTDKIITIIQSPWISTAERLPPDETPVPVIVRGEMHIGALFWETPSWEDTFQAFRYWDDPTNDGQCWEWTDVTHWLDCCPIPTEQEQIEVGLALMNDLNNKPIDIHMDVLVNILKSIKN